MLHGEGYDSKVRCRAGCVRGSQPERHRSVWDAFVDGCLGELLPACLNELTVVGCLARLGLAVGERKGSLLLWLLLANEAGCSEDAERTGDEDASAKYCPW